ncbi:MAG: hypothetical protein SFZ24_00805 [Planctomycetota bacterium]|nr:hypothetical protein [Planctomycetota bacterium]
MSLFGLPRPIEPGLTARERNIDRSREKRRAIEPPGSTRAADEVELSSAPEVDSADPTRVVRGNADQEAHEDRTEHGYYTRSGTKTLPPATRHRLDISG